MLLIFLPKFQLVENTVAYKRYLKKILSIGHFVGKMPKIEVLLLGTLGLSMKEKNGAIQFV